MHLFTQIPLLFLYNSHKTRWISEVIFLISQDFGSGTVSNHSLFQPFAVTHSSPEDVKSLLQKICGFFATEMA